MAVKGEIYVPGLNCSVNTRPVQNPLNSCSAITYLFSLLLFCLVHFIPPSLKDKASKEFRFSPSSFYPHNNFVKKVKLEARLATHWASWQRTGDLNKSPPLHCRGLWCHYCVISHESWSKVHPARPPFCCDSIQNQIFLEATWCWL